MLIDSHAHLHDRKFDRDREKVIKNLKRDGIEKVINIGTSIRASKQAIDLAEKYDNIYATVGINCGGEEEYPTIPQLRPLLKSKKVVAIGEIGLDYHHYPDEKEIQKKCFRKQIDLANEFNLPIVVHDRKANQDTFDIIKGEKEKNEKLRGVIHCYSGDLNLAKEYVKLGFYISIAGPVTYRSAKKLKDVAAEIPLDNLFIETDAPYLSPGQIGRKRNEPAYVRYVAGAIADLKGIPFQLVERKTANNIKRLFNIT
ncbi:TatD family hydrolase [Dethiothermospora halolimnae]|uniref:TatD family hydrolase n=1 Tax=Dethiothermospora halolimnae TaxID=3114390 RepID=UPI003CCB8637